MNVVTLFDDVISISNFLLKKTLTSSLIYKEFQILTFSIKKRNAKEKNEWLTTFHVTISSEIMADLFFNIYLTCGDGN